MLGIVPQNLFFYNTPCSSKFTYDSQGYPLKSFSYYLFKGLKEVSERAGSRKQSVTSNTRDHVIFRVLPATLFQDEHRPYAKKDSISYVRLENKATKLAEQDFLAKYRL